MRWKYAKLVTNLGNVVEVMCGPAVRGGALTRRLRDEAHAVFEAHEIAYATVAEDEQRRGEHLRVGLVDDAPRPGGSVWPSVARGVGDTEVDYLCGEVARLGRLAGVAPRPTPSCRPSPGRSPAASGAPSR